jgi:hypothetical protein
MATDPPAQATAWIAVSPDTDPMVDAHIEHAGQVVGETHRGDDWRQALAWARARTDRVFIRFDYAETTWWAGAGPPPGDPPPPALAEDPDGNRALLVRRRPDEPVRLSPARRPRS